MNEKDQDTPASQALAREQDLKGPSGNPVPPSNDRFPRLFGLIVILIAFGFVGGWASLAPIDSAVVAQGTVTVDTYRKTVQHLEGGIIRTLHVRDGDTVERGDLLIQLDETQARSSYLVNYNRYLAELARRARLEAELEGEERIDFPEELTAGAEG
ncbi:biotin/lipoyl-binding protein, partial [Ectothiorhodospira haloalkaliphila]